MLKSSNYYIQDIENLKDFITVIFVIIDDIYNQYIPKNIKNRLHKDIAILSDSEIITISIVGELISIDSEKARVSYVSKNLKDLFLKMCDRSRFNRTQRNLMTVTNEISKKLNLMIECFSSKKSGSANNIIKTGNTNYNKRKRGYNYVLYKMWK